MTATDKQYVCLICGYNMAGYCPDVCPFCGAARNRFITATECAGRFRVTETAVTKGITRLNSQPALGLEHAAYRIITDQGEIWIDCPSTFTADLAPATAITFTHHHFLGSVNLYREHFGCRARIHKADSETELCRGFTFDDIFIGDHNLSGIKAFHYNGHTPGFTFYIFKSTLFVCDYLFYRQGSLHFNPYGSGPATFQGGRKLLKLVTENRLTKVCGYNYVSDFSPWLEDFNILLSS